MTAEEAAKTQEQLDVWGEIHKEAGAARERYGPFTSTHEALGVLCEEFDELKEAIHQNALGSIQNEAIQVSAVAFRLAVICEKAMLGCAEAFKRRSGIV